MSSKYRVVQDIYLSESRIDLKAPMEIDIADYTELKSKPELVESFLKSGAIAPVDAHKSAKKESSEAK